MQPTSFEAYEEVKKKLGYKQMRVLEAIQIHAYAITNSELAEYLKWSINTVTPRTNELVNIKKIVKEDCKRICRITGRTAIAWRIKSPDEIKERQMELRFAHHQAMPPAVCTKP